MELEIKNLTREQAVRMKKHLAIEHPITRGKMELECEKDKGSKSIKQVFKSIGKGGKGY